MSGRVLGFAPARVRLLGERFLALQTALDDVTGCVDASALERDLERVAHDASAAISAMPHPDELSSALDEALEARATWREIRERRGPDADAAADRFTLALIELALRLRGRPRRAAPARAGG